MVLWRIVGLCVLAAGIVLLVLGIQATGAVSEQIREEFTGRYSGRTVWYIIGGSAAIAGGGGLAIFGGKIKGPGS